MPYKAFRLLTYQVNDHLLKIMIIYLLIYYEREGDVYMPWCTCGGRILGRSKSFLLLVVLDQIVRLHKRGLCLLNHLAGQPINDHLLRNPIYNSFQK